MSREVIDLTDDNEDAAAAGAAKRARPQGLAPLEAQRHVSALPAALLPVRSRSPLNPVRTFLSEELPRVDGPASRRSAPPAPRERIRWPSAAPQRPRAPGAGEPACVVCLDAARDAAVVDCGHRAACLRCLQKLQSEPKRCPVCRVPITHVIRLYD